MSRTGPLALALLSLLAGSEAAAAPAPAKLPFPRPDIKEWTLANGLDVVYLGVHKTPIVTVQVWYHVGSKDDPRDQRGTAHMFEHMMFQGTRHVPPGMYARFIDDIGGSENATTREDTTLYYETVPRQYLGFAIELEAERMRNLIIRGSMVRSQRAVVERELRASIEGSPIALAVQRLRALAFTRHPYAWLPAGDKKDLDRLTVAGLKRFYDLYYRPNNATLIVVGDVGEDEVRAAAQRWFGPLERGPEPPRPARSAVEPRQTQRRDAGAPPAPLGFVVGGYHGPPAKSPDIYPLQVLASILSAGPTSRLYQRIVLHDRSGVSSGAQLSAFEDPGLFMVFGVYVDAAQGQKVAAALANEIDRVQHEPVSEDELEKAKNQITSSYIFGLEQVEGLANEIGSSRILLGDARAWLDDYDKYLAVTADDVQRVARTYLTPNNLTLLTIPPAARAAHAATPAAGGGR